MNDTAVSRQGKSYVVKTYGCQMNEHDSERISGLLEADGMNRVDDVADADVIVLNTCCIRENADNKLYGALGHLKVLKEQNPDVQIAVGGCLAQKDRDTIMDRAGHVDVVFGTHNVHRALRTPRPRQEHGPIVEILEATARDDQEAFPSALPARREVDHAGWLTIQIGCDNTCAFCIVPAVRGPRSLVPSENLSTKHVISPLTASARSRSSVRTSTAMAATSLCPPGPRHQRGRRR